MIIGDKQAPATQKQKATDHIDEGLRLANFKTLKLSQIFFLILLEFQNEDLKDIGRRVSRSFAGQFPIYSGFAGQFLIFYISDALFSTCKVCYQARSWGISRGVRFHLSEEKRLA